MLRDGIDKYYFNEDMNCSETIMLVCNDYYSLDITMKEVQLLSCFGGGMCCGKTCGAVAGALAIFSKMNVEGSAHRTEGFKEKCGGLVALLEEKLGSVNCDDIKPIYSSEERRCVAPVEIVADVLEDYIAKQGKKA